MCKLILSILASFILLSSGCPFVDQDATRNTNESGQVNTDIPTGRLIEVDSYTSVEDSLVKGIKKIYIKLRLAPLPETAQPEEFEFRLWTNLGGLGDAKLLVVRLTVNDKHAYFFDIHKAMDPIRFRKENLASPKSDWNELPYQVRSRLTTPKGLVRDPQFPLARDEPLILLEVLDKEEYRRVFYGQNTSFADGMRLIALCDYLANEFGVDMACRGV